MIELLSRLLDFGTVTSTVLLAYFCRNQTTPRHRNQVTSEDDQPGRLAGLRNACAGLREHSLAPKRSRKVTYRSANAF